MKTFPIKMENNQHTLFKTKCAEARISMQKCLSNFINDYSNQEVEKRNINGYTESELAARNAQHDAENEDVETQEYE